MSAEALDKPRQADPSQLTPASQVCSGPLPSPSEPNLISPPKRGPRQAATPNRKSAHIRCQRSRGFPIDHIHRRNQRHEQSVSERCLERGSPNHSVHELQLTRELQAKKNMLLMIKWRSSISEGLVGLFPVAVTHGLKLGRSWSRQTHSEESDPAHQRPSSTNSFHHPLKTRSRANSNLYLQTSRKDRYARRESHVVPYYTMVVSCRILQSPGKSPHTCPPIKHARYRTNTNGALTGQWTSMTNFHESKTRATGMHQEPCGSEMFQDAPVPVTKDWFGPVTRQNKQSTHQTKKKGWNRCPTQKTR